MRNSAQSVTCLCCHPLERSPRFALRAKDGFGGALIPARIKRPPGVKPNLAEVEFQIWEDESGKPLTELVPLTRCAASSARDLRSAHASLGQD